MATGGGSIINAEKVIIAAAGSIFSTMFLIGGLALSEMRPSKNGKIDLKREDLQKLMAEFTNSLSKTREATTRALLAEGATVEDVTITDSEYLNQIGQSAKIFSVTPEQKDAAKQEMEDDLTSRG